MVSELGKLVRDIEKKIGLPRLSEVSQILKNLPDDKTLKQVRGIISDVGKVKGSPEELAVALTLIKYIVEADMEHLNAIKEITGNILKLSKLLPKDALTQLPLGEIIEEIKKKIAEE